MTPTRETPESRGLWADCGGGIRAGCAAYREPDAAHGELPGGAVTYGKGAAPACPAGGLHRIPKTR